MLSKPPALPPLPAWLVNARAFERMMIHELPGHATHPLITAFFQFTQLAGTDAGAQDETPWCSAFACACMELAGIESPRHALAHSWLRWGVEIPDLREGAIVVLENTNHVTISNGDHYAGTQFWGLGGNQNNKVCTRLYDKSRVVSIRWTK